MSASVLELGDIETAWLRRFRPAASAELTLVCLPHAGGAASAWRSLAARLPGAVDTLAVQYPGRQDRRHEPPLTRLADLADELAAVLRPIEEISRLGGTDPQVLSAVRADYTAIETYQAEPGRAVDCPLRVLNGTQDPQVAAAEAEAWWGHTTADCIIRFFPGGHFYLNEVVDEVAAVVADDLAAFLVAARP